MSDNRAIKIGDITVIPDLSVPIGTVILAPPRLEDESTEDWLVRCSVVTNIDSSFENGGSGV